MSDVFFTCMCVFSRCLPKIPVHSAKALHINALLHMFGILSLMTGYAFFAILINYSM